MEQSAGQAGPAATMIAAIARFWWAFLAAGIVWVLIALAILQFDRASITTVGVLIGIMLILSAFQNFALGAMVGTGAKWIWWLFAVLLLVGGIIALMSPENTFAALADILGFVFLIIGVFWTIDAFVSRGANPLWWLGLISGILMVILAFWTSGQFFIEKAYLLLVFAGIWALLHGITDIVRAFQLRALGKAV
ncbi:MAG TPA: DUF308 domain-containing protein [Thermoleophilaceae bacterium]|nr:DUF308 domain-containing protein [Thermoleophilaceae bacterium]